MCNKSKQNYKFSIFKGGFYKTTEEGFLNLPQIEHLIRSGNNGKWIESFEKLRTSPKSIRDELKPKIPFLIPASNSRKQSDIKEYTGIAVLDFDGVNGAEELRDKVFRNPFVISAFVSPSGNGVKAFVSIPICESVEEFRMRYDALKREIEQQFPELDSSASGPQLPMFLSYDSDIRTRNDYTTFLGKAEPVVYKNTVQQVDCNPTEKDLYCVKMNIKKMIDKIVDGNGHPRVQACGLFNGNLVAGYNLDLNEVIAFAETEIENNLYLIRHDKLKRKYLKTLTWAFKTGYDNRARKFD